MSDYGQKYRKTRKTKKINGLFFLLYPLSSILYSLLFPLPLGVLQAPRGVPRDVVRSESQTLQLRLGYVPRGACLFRLSFPNYRRFVASTISPCLRIQGRILHPRRKTRGHLLHCRQRCIRRKCQYRQTFLLFA